MEASASDSPILRAMMDMVPATGPVGWVGDVPEVVTLLVNYTQSTGGRMTKRRTRWHGERLEEAQSLLWGITNHFVHLDEFAWDDEFTEWEENVLALADLIRQTRGHDDQHTETVRQ